ncbi:hypothetical protein ATI61_11375 [Archangium gephyra]|uniref:Uncharacterized protein n=1 Tax=Archangium gephyra TaxID=48 RepID=A0AAC8Q969_9BACT|nr:hypothetical protein [Archangium gephyra]AKJ02886.1 Hypothetical protein AA314_04512 [Archangium gephyra]REG25012.1 hypothetical protein ATI61_11375 [Archangium gephyra]
MSEWGEVDRALIGRLRVRSGSEEPLSARLRLEGLLSAVHLSPLGLPPSAILCIRHLRDPKPGVLSPRRLATRPPPDWEQALQQSLREHLSRAVRPALGSVPTSAEAVVFADPSELLASLASDVCGGVASSRWWWRSLYRDVELWRQLVKEWLRQPEYVPAALESLATRGEARAFLGRLSDEEAHALLLHVVRRYGLPALVPALEAHSGLEEVEESLEEVEESSDSSGPAPRASVHTAQSPAPASEAPWEHYVPEARSAAVGLEQHTLLGVALLLRRAPSEVARPSFAPAVARWRRAARQTAQRDPGIPSRSGPERPRVRSERPSRPTPGAGHTDVRPVPEDSPAPELSVPERKGPPSSQAVPERHVSGRPEASTPPVSTSPVPAPPPGEAVSENLAREPRVARPAATEASPLASHSGLSRTPGEEPPVTRWPGKPIRTQLGGLFYLLNLGLFLELYGDFSTPFSPGLALPVWDFLTLLGHRLLVEAHREDPVWDVLERLAGRAPGTPPGEGFEPPAEWRVPPSWLRPFREPGNWRWDVVPPVHRLRVLHPAGFLVVEVPADSGDAEAQARHECGPYSGRVPFALVPGALSSPGDEPAPLERWLGWLVPYVRARLQRALGVEEPAALARVLLEHEARLHVTEAHLDVLFSLADLPLPIRFAGLDRDIGWLPAAGRHVRFHFE